MFSKRCRKNTPKPLRLIKNTVCLVEKSQTNSPEQSKHTTLSTILSQWHLLLTKEIDSWKLVLVCSQRYHLERLFGIKESTQQRHENTIFTLCCQGKTANWLPGISSHVKMLHRGVFCRVEECSCAPVPALSWPADLLCTIYRFCATNLISVSV